MSQSAVIQNEYLEIQRHLSDQPSMWDGYKFGNYGLYAEYCNDFFSFLVGEYVQTLTNSSSPTIADAPCGQLAMINTAGASDAINLQLGTLNGTTGLGFNTAVGKKLWFECRAKVSDATLTTFVLGLVNADTTPDANTAGIHFIKPTAGTAINFLSTLSSVSTTVSALATCDTNFHTYGFVCNGRDSIDYWFDGIKMGSVTSNIATAALKLTMFIKNGEAAAKTLTIDYVRVVQER